MFRFLSWNVRGLNRTDKCTAVKAFIRGCKCGVVCLQETKLSSISQAKFLSFCGFHIRDFRSMDAAGTRGGILSAWNPALFECGHSWAGSFSLNTVLRRRVDEMVFTLSNIYGPTAAALKEPFFQELRDIGSRAAGIWAMVGDFNLLLSRFDKNGPPPHVSDMLRFRNVINSLGLSDLPLSNRAFTWTNGRPNPTLERLDRAFISRDWALFFPHSTLRALPRPTSDHSPLLLTAFSFVPAANLFRFEAFWLRYREAQDVVTETWTTETGGADSVRRFANKLDLVSGRLKEWSVGLSGVSKKQATLCLAWID